MIRRYLLQLINKLINWSDSKIYVGFLLIWVVFSYPFFLQGKIPAPLDFLVNFYAPWDAYYDGPIRNSALSDVVSQIIPWKIFNAEELKSGRIPIWNLYNLAGTPHLGNWQSGVLYPTTLLFLFLPVQIAWSLHILLQPLLAGIFMILFLRSLHLSRISSLLGALAFAYGGFMTTWFEWGTLGHALLWLPLALYGIERKREDLPASCPRPPSYAKRCGQVTAPAGWQAGGRGKREFILTILALTMSFFAGHPQISIYVILVAMGYFIYRNFGNLNVRQKVLYPLSFILLPLFLAAPQILPAIQVYFNSARSLVEGISWAKAFLIPVSGLLTFLAPDFFGNPVTRNSWSNFSYVEMQGYVGIATLVLAMVAALNIKRSDLAAARSDLIRFLVWGGFIALIFATKNPVSELIINLKLPIISSSSPARLMGVVDFSLAVLAALGLDRLMTMIKERKSTKAFYGSWLAAASGLAAMWIWTFISVDLNVLISRRNLILPSLLTLTIILSVIPGLTRNLSRIKSGTSYRFQLRAGMTLIPYFLFLILLLDLFRFHHKFTPYSDISMWYPRLPVLTELGNRQERTFGLLDGDLNLPFRIYSLDGYDPMMNAEYVKLTYSGDELVKRNRITGPYFPKGQPETVDLVGRLGGKWFVDSATPGGAEWDLRLWEYGGQFQQVWKDEKYQILFNTGAVDELVEPLGWMRDQQYRLFFLGIGISGITMVGLVLYGTAGLTRNNHL